MLTPQAWARLGQSTAPPPKEKNRGGVAMGAHGAAQRPGGGHTPTLGARPASGGPTAPWGAACPPQHARNPPPAAHRPALGKTDDI